jgi:hypothetical protein
MMTMTAVSSRLPLRLVFDDGSTMISLLLALFHEVFFLALGWEVRV